MPVLIVKNAAHEGPGTIADFLQDAGIAFTVLDFSGCDAKEEDIPDIAAFSHLVIMGGPMAVYESDGAPFLHYEVAMIRSFILSKKPVLGICLGAQMIAYALKTDVYAGGTQEVGWYGVEITPDGMADPVFSTLSVEGGPLADVFQWHGDTFDLPKNSARLASSAVYQNQAFRYKDNVYGLQFHIEIKPEMIEEWFQKEEDTSAGMLKQAREIFPEYQKRAFNFYKKFFT